MSAGSNFAVQLSGLIAVVGASLCAVGDVLLLAVRVNLADYPHLHPSPNCPLGRRRWSHYPDNGWYGAVYWVCLLHRSY